MGRISLVTRAALPAAARGPPRGGSVEDRACFGRRGIVEGPAPLPGARPLEVVRLDSY